MHSSPTRAIAPAERTHGVTYAVRDILLVADEAKAKGLDLLYLNIGDPLKFDFATPKHIIDAAYKAMLRGETGYSPSSGTGEAIAAIKRTAANSGIKNIGEIFVTTGVSEAIDLCLTALLNDGDDLLIPSPGYPLYSAILARLGIAKNEYYLDEDNAFEPDVADIAAKVTPRTRGIVLINPNNPTGSVASEKTLRGIIDIARKHNLVIFSDEIYDKLVYDDEKQHISIASLADDVPFVTFNGLSKSYMAPGFRIGWGIMSGDLPALKNYADAVLKLTRARLSANHPLQACIAPALEGDQSHLKEVNAKIKRRCAITVDMLNAIDGVSCVAPSGTFYAFPKLDIEVPDEEFVKTVVRETGVVIVHGSGFGQKPGTRHFRTVFLPNEAQLERAYDLIGKLVKRFR